MVPYLSWPYEWMDRISHFPIGDWESASLNKLLMVAFAEDKRGILSVISL